MSASILKYSIYEGTARRAKPRVILDEDILFGSGCYRVEGIGIQLFARITGDYFTILGLPLLALLDYLRLQGVVAK